MSYPHHDDRAPEPALAGYLEEATALLAAAPGPLETGAATLPGQSSDFEHLRWFDLPAACLSPADSR